MEGVRNLNGGHRAGPIEGLRWLQRQLDPVGDDRVLATRAAGALMILGALLVAVAVALPPGAQGSDAIIIGIGAIAAIVGVVLWRRGQVSDRLLAATAALGTVVITTTTLEAGPARGTEDNEVVFLWVLAYSFWFLPLRGALAQLALVGVADALLLADSNAPGGDAITRWLVTMSSFLVVGLVLSGLRSRLERQREEGARLAVMNERMRIARELHDATGHGVNVMSIQAAAALNTLQSDPETARHALEAIKRTSRDTAEDMRRMLAVLREREPTVKDLDRSTLARLDPLIRESRNAGVPVELEVEGAPIALPSGLDQTAYRVVQEGLTNVRRHAGPGASAKVSVLYAPHSLELQVLDDGRAKRALTLSNGLIGMRERVEAFDGTLEAAPRSGGGFRIKAVFPLRRSGDGTVRAAANSG
jgi:signal transduction histidine kinase